MATIVTTAWITSGVCVWLAMIIDAMPVVWTSRNPRVEGMDEMTWFYLPVCVLFGPLFWIAAIINEVRHDHR